MDKKYICVVNKKLAAFLVLKCFSCLAEQFVGDEIVYIFQKSNGIADLSESEFGKGNYYFDNKICF